MADNKKISELPVAASVNNTDFTVLVDGNNSTNKRATIAQILAAGTIGGTVTSVGVTGANGIAVSGSPITSSGTISLGLGNITPTSVAASGTVSGSNISGTNTGDQAIQLVGDVEASPSFGTLNTSIATGSVTNAKLANMTGPSLKGRVSGGSGAVSDLTPAQVAAALPAVIGDTGLGGTQGLVPAPNAGDAAAKKFLRADATWAAPAINDLLPTQSGQNGKVLKSDGSNVSWQADSGGSGTVTSVGIADGTDITVSGSPVTTSGTITVNLTNTGVVAGTYGSASSVPAIVVDVKGRIGSVTSTPIAINAGAVSGLSAVATTGAYGSLTGTPSLGTISSQNSTAVNITGGTITGITDLAVADGGTGASNAADARNNLGLGTISTQAANSVSITGGTMANVQVTGLPVPTGADWAATKAYVDSVAIGVTHVKTPVVAATTTNITLSGEQTIDGVAVVAGNRVLVKNQSAPAENGIYDCAVGAWSRSSDCNTPAELQAGVYVVVTGGTVNNGDGYILTTAPVILGTDPVEFTLFINNTGVTSITGTAGQITASAATGPVTLSLPSALTGISSVSSSGALGLNAGGTNQNITLTPSGTGGVAITATEGSQRGLMVGGSSFAAGFPLRVRLDRSGATWTDVVNLDAGNTSSAGIQLQAEGGSLAIAAHSTAHSVWPDTGYVFANSLLSGGLALGTGTTAPITFLTNNTERARITSGGNVLVGTTTDGGHRLQVVGATPVIAITRDSGTDSPRINFSDGTNSALFGMSGSASGLVASSVAGDLVARVPSGRSIRFTVDGGTTNSMAIAATTGAVSIASTTASTSTSTGSLVTSGGLGVAGAGYFGSSIVASGNRAVTLNGGVGQVTAQGSSGGWDAVGLRFAGSAGTVFGALFGEGAVDAGSSIYLGIGTTPSSDKRITIPVAGGITLNAGGTNQNIALVPSGTGGVTLGTAGATTNTLTFANGSALLDTGNSALVLRRQGGAANASIIIADTTQAAGGRLSTAGSNTLLFQNHNGATEYGRFVSNGNLLLGTTTNNGERLQVNGTALFGNTGNVASRVAINNASDTVPAIGLGTANFGWGFLERLTEGDLVLNRRVSGVASDVMRFTRADGRIALSSTTASTSTTTGALTVAGGLGLAGDLNLGGNITDSGALTISTSSNGNLTLAPNGTGTANVGNQRIATAADRNALEPRGGVTLDGTTSGRVTSTLTGQNIGTDPFSVTVTFRVPSAQTLSYHGIFLIGPNSGSVGANNNIGCWLESGSLRFYWRAESAGTNSANALINNFITNYGGKVVQLTFVRNSSGNPTVYVNAVAQTLSSVTFSGTGTWQGQIDSTFFGLGYTTSSDLLTQAIYSASLYNLSLSAADVLEIYELGGAVPDRLKFGSQTNRFSNPGFETAGGGGATTFADWIVNVSGTSTITRDTSEFFSGVASAKNIIDSSNSGVDIGLSVSSPGKVYRLRFYAKADSASSDIVKIDSGNGPLVSGTAYSLTTSWQLFESTFTTPANDPIVKFRRSNAANRTYWLDNTSLVQVGAVVHIPFAEGAGLTAKDQSTNALDATLTATGVSWVRPSKGLFVSDGAATLAAGGSNQNITLTPSGTGIVTTASRITTTSTTASSSTTTGSIVTSGGVGVAGNLNVGGSQSRFFGSSTSTPPVRIESSLASGTGGVLNFLTTVGQPGYTTLFGTTGDGSDATYSSLGLGATNTIVGQQGVVISDAARGLLIHSVNSNIRFGTGNGASSALRATLNADTLAVLPTTASTSTTTGALTVAGGVGVAGAAYVGGEIYAERNAGSYVGITIANASSSASAGSQISFLQNGTTERGRIFAGGNVSGITIRSIPGGTTGDVVFNASGVTIPQGSITGGTSGLTINSGLRNVAGAADVLKLNATALSSGGNTAPWGITLGQDSRSATHVAGFIDFFVNNLTTGTPTSPVFAGRFAPSGNLLLGTTTDDANTRLQVSATTGGILVNSGAVSNGTYPALRLTSSGAGWGSGIQLANTTASTGRNWGIYSGSGGDLVFDNTTGLFAWATVTGSSVSNGRFAINHTTASTSTTTGALTVAGGLGVAGDAWVGGEVLAGTGGASAPQFSFTTDTDTGLYRNNTNSVGIATGGVQRALFNHNAPTVGNIWNKTFEVGHPTGGRLAVSADTAGTSYLHTNWVDYDNTTDNRWEWNATTTVGAGIITFGTGAGYEMRFSVRNNGATTAGAAVNFVDAMNVRENGLNVLTSTASTSTTTGALTVAGGLGVAGAINAGSIQNTPIGSTTANTGAFTTLTATGNVTFDTNTLFVDSVNDRVGVGTTTPAYKLQVSGSGAAIAATDSAVTTRLIASSAASGGFIETTTNHPLIFRTNETERARIETTGNFGIGTTSPSYKLHVSGNSADIAATDGVVTTRIIAAAPVLQGLVETTSNHPLVFRTNQVEHVRLTTSGSLGIGTGSPTLRLDCRLGTAVTNPTWAAADVAVFGNDSANNTVVQILSANNKFGQLQFSDPDARAQGALQYSHTDDFMAFLTAGSERMRITSAGNLGIGTTSPTVKLSVDVGSANNDQIQLVSTDTSGSLTAKIANGSGEAAFGVSAVGDLIVRGRTSGKRIRFDINSSEKAAIDSNGNIIAGASAALATTATNGFLYVPTCAGTPTGTPTAITGMAPIVVNTTNNKLYFYSGGAWRDAGP